MRVDFNILLLGLFALSSLPAGSSRALPVSSSGALNVYQYNGKDNEVRAAVRFGAPKVGGGSKTGGGKPGGGTGPPPSLDGGRSDTPPRIGAGDPVASNPDSYGTSPHIGDPYIFCRSSGCGGGASSSPDFPTLSTEQKTVLGNRGSKGINLLASPKKGEDLTQRIMDNYNVKKIEFEESVEDTISDIGLETKYGFKTSGEDWQTWTVNSKNNNVEPVIKMSFSRAKSDDGKENLALIAHERFAERDGNRYQLTESKDTIKDKDGNLLEQPDRDMKAAPVSQLVFEAAQRSDSTKTPADRVFLVSENVANEDAQKAINEALSVLGNTGGSKVLRKEATGAEADHFRIIAGTDDNYSYINTAGRNPDFFKDYDLTEIEIWEGPEYKMSISLVKRA
ncbi:hypothetical protein EKO04_001234 [Ascochyta lentis]|uniref:Uncharacterized protein n=1 Tax=Ascochyta lentis TaxID=205686 RepID=A0A8H7JAB6_9PLEO|nr:hypothetical protein EKO04_001234 [Ascochyta lentis]